MKIPEIRGAIFDGDDTLFDNNPGRESREDFSRNLHERSLLCALKEVGHEKEIEELLNVPPELSVEAFHTAPEHTIESGIINMFMMLGIDNMISLLEKIIERKDLKHLALIETEGTPIEGSVDFVRGFSSKFAIPDRLAMATTSPMRDAVAFIAKIGLSDLFPNERVVAKEAVKLYKPFPDVYNLAFSKLGLNEEDRNKVVAFEDNPRGITAAKKAGLVTVGIATMKTVDELRGLDIPPDLVAESYAELSEIFGV